MDNKQKPVEDKPVNPGTERPHFVLAVQSSVIGVKSAIKPGEKKDDGKGST